MLSRRSTLSLIPISAGMFMAGHANAADTSSPERHTLGQEDAVTVVQGYFSFTCPHCSHFEKEIFPELKTKLIDTGKTRWVFREYPLDGLALMISSVAWNLTSEKYYPFMRMMLSTQNSWMTSDIVQARKNIETRAALAGILPAVVDEAFVDNSKLRQNVIEERIRGNKVYGVDSTPSFVLSRIGKTGFEKRQNMTTAEFIKWVEG